MRDSLADDPAFFTADSCNLDALDELCSRTLTAEEVPLADRIESNIPIYDGASLRARITVAEARRGLMAEWARNFRAGSGVIVIQNGYADTAPIDAATEVYLELIEAERTHHSGADHFAASGANDRLWNSAQKLCLANPEVFAAYFGNPLIDAASEAWLGPNYQMTTQVNLVRPGGTAQTAHRDYHLGFQTPEDCARYPAHVHDLSPVMTLQAGIAHCDMPVASGPTKLLPFSQAYRPGYAAYRLPEFSAYFEENYAQLPLSKGDLLFFNPALFHAAGDNTTQDVARFVNLMQIGSALGRTLENLDRRAMSLALYPVLLANDAGLDAAEIDAAISSCAEGYPFPTNLDTDPPAGGLAPPSMAALMRKGLSEGQSARDFARTLEDQATRQTA